MVVGVMIMNREYKKGLLQMQLMISVIALLPLLSFG